MWFTKFVGQRVRNCYRPQRSCGQGNIFTPVCHSVCRGGGGLPQCMLGCHPPDQADPPRSDTPLDQTPLGQGRPPLRPGRHPPQDQADTPPRPGRSPRPGRQSPPNPISPPPTQPSSQPPRDQADPPREQTPAYSLRAAGTHPTGMHSCLICNRILNLTLKFVYKPFFLTFRQFSVDFFSWIHMSFSPYMRIKDLVGGQNI